MKEIRIGGVPEHFNYPWHYANQKGYFANKEINLSWIDYDTGTGAMCKDLREGNLDMAVVLTEGIVADIIKGNPSQILQVYVQTPLLWGIHVPAKSDINSEEEIRDKVYAISRYGSGSHLMAFVDAKTRNWDSSKIQFKVVNNLPGAIEAFSKKEAEVFFWEKFTTKPFVDKGDFKRVGIRPTPWPCFMLVARKEFIEQNKDITQSVTDIILKATSEVQKSKEASIRSIAEFYSLQSNDVAEWFEITKWSQDKFIDKKILEEVMNTLEELKIIESKVTADSLVNHYK